MRRALCELALTPASIRPLGLDARRSALFDLTTEDGRRLLVDGEGASTWSASDGPASAASRTARRACPRRARSLQRVRRQPLIAIPTYHLQAGEIGRWGRGGYALPTPYVDAVTRAGGIAVLLPSRPDVDVAAALEPFDGVLLPGGGDIDPSRYGQAPHPSVYGIDENRDAFELAAVAELVRRRIPALAICRGMQIVDVASGGSLIQHVPDHPHLEPHGVPGGGGQSARHPVRVEPDTRLHAAVGRPADGCVDSCTSWHHQAVDAVGAGLRPVAWSEDGLIEALEPTDPSAPWMVAVQWHPETSAHKDAVQQALFDAFVAECPTG